MMSLPGSVSWEGLCVLLRGILARRNESNTLPKQYLSQLGLSNTFFCWGHITQGCFRFLPPLTVLQWSSSQQETCVLYEGLCFSCFSFYSGFVSACEKRHRLQTLHNGRSIHILVEHLSPSLSAQSSCTSNALKTPNSCRMILNCPPPQRPS